MREKFIEVKKYNVIFIGDLVGVMEDDEFNNEDCDPTPFDKFDVVRDGMKENVDSSVPYFDGSICVLSSYEAEVKRRDGNDFIESIDYIDGTDEALMIFVGGTEEEFGKAVDDYYDKSIKRYFRK